MIEYGLFIQKGLVFSFLPFCERKSLAATGETVEEEEEEREVCVEKRTKKI